MDDSNNVEMKALVSRAQDGEGAALEEIVRRSQDKVHHLAMRMLANPEDTAEATQEILILVVTKLSTFRGESGFSTWVYRVAVNYLLTARRARAKEVGLTFEMFREDLETGLVADPAPSAEDMVLLNQLRISCTMAMLLCLDPAHRAAYVLGDILELDHAEAAAVLDISRQNYRQRLARARRKVVDFTSQSCGIVNRNAKCSCPRRLPAAMAAGRVSADMSFYEEDEAPEYGDVLTRVERLEADLTTLQLQNATPFFRSPKDLATRIAEIVGARH